ncbi:protein tyrosine phosphatase [Paenibacillus nanensis]|uniref:Tyrosine-protein phosphatase n=1 Tax=Paenibacillus nanensis TaxID=393251 RepID=A0A3A1UL81_9BACL|nr:CpsB/CapC family capsule biosynthesis tyrosine phosphatase [Paenibacillus nanensis]RIX45883.1 protein tyrosine phosphatase [Paenibacillus nanensis]
MIDIHTHILPGLDDGASNERDAIDMARAASAEGITTIVATPHHANGKYMNFAADVREHADGLNVRLAQAGIPISIVPGQEIRVHDDLLDAWGRGELLTLAGSRYVMLEMPSSRIPHYMSSLIHELHVMKLRPIIAHPERNAEVVEHPERLEELIELGAYGQVTTHSLLGGFGKKIEQASWRLMKQGSIHIVSSDAHHVERRGFRLREAHSAVNRVMGEEWSEYFKGNAEAVLADKPFGEQPPVQEKSGGVFRKFMAGLLKK